MKKETGKRTEILNKIEKFR